MISKAKDEGFVVRVGGRSRAEVVRLLLNNGVLLNSHAETLLAHPALEAPTGQNLRIVERTVDELGFKHGAVQPRIFEAARNQGLELCPLVTGPYLRLAMMGQANAPDSVLSAPSFGDVREEGDECVAHFRWLGESTGNRDVAVGVSKPFEVRDERYCRVQSPCWEGVHELLSEVIRQRYSAYDACQIKLKDHHLTRGHIAGQAFKLRLVHAEVNGVGPREVYRAHGVIQGVRGHSSRSMD